MDQKQEQQQKQQCEYELARQAEIRDGKDAWKYLPSYAKGENLFGTKQYYEDIFQKLKGVPEEGRDGYYLLALMETKDILFEAMYEYQAGIRELFKAEFARLSKEYTYKKLPAEQKALVVAAGYRACRNRTLLYYKYASGLDRKYEMLEKEEIPEEIWRIAGEAKQCFERKGLTL